MCDLFSVLMSAGLQQQNMSHKQSFFTVQSAQTKQLASRYLNGIVIRIQLAYLQSPITMPPLTALRALIHWPTGMPAASDTCQPDKRLYSSMATGCHCTR